MDLNTALWNFYMRYKLLIQVIGISKLMLDTLHNTILGKSCITSHQNRCFLKVSFLKSHRSTSFYSLSVVCLIITKSTLSKDYVRKFLDKYETKIRPSNVVFHMPFHLFSTYGSMTELVVCRTHCHLHSFKISSDSLLNSPSFNKNC